MEKPNQKNLQPLPVDINRRRLTKAGFAVPAVLGVLACRPVLADAPHNCTVSGQVSGNASTHVQGECAKLGTRVASDWIALWPEWPDKTDFVNESESRLELAKARNFANTPFTKTQFGNAYQAVARNLSATTRPATVLEVLLGRIPQYNNDGTYRAQDDPNLTLTAIRPRAPILLGQEAIVTYLNAINDAPDFPLDKAQVVAMFNSILVTGVYTAVSGSLSSAWDGSDVLQYFQSLHA